MSASGFGKAVGKVAGLFVVGFMVICFWALAFGGLVFLRALIQLVLA